LPAAQISRALRSNLTALGLSEKEEQGRLFATLRFVEQGLAEDLRPMLPLVGLHESYLDSDYFEAMGNEIDSAWTRPQMDRLMAALSIAGLLRDIGSAIYQMHPLLTSYLRSHGSPPNSYQRAFVDVTARLADELAPRELHEQRAPFFYYGANFYFALQLAERLAMNQHFAALTQSLASYAENSRNFVEASRLYMQLARHSVKHEATVYHQLGMPAAFQETHDPHEANKHVENFLLFHRHAPPAEKLTLERLWHEAKLGPFPPETPPDPLK
jgi:hypothetical protein